MITALVQFKLAQPVSRDKAKELFMGSAPNYREVPGLLRKYYLLSEDGGTAGGAYLWKTRAEAEALYTDDWRKTVEERYGAPPSLTYFESPVVVDNVVGEVVSD